MDSPETTDDAQASRWYQRVLPVSGLVLLVLALAALIVPSFRDQVELSTSRKAQPYVALYFARTPDGAQLVCSRARNKISVRFDVESHLEKEQRLAYRVAVRPTARGAKAQSRSGSVQPAPGGATRVSKTFAVPRNEGYTVSVRLPALDQQLRAHCSGRHS